MNIEVLSKHDLEEFRIRLLDDLKKMVNAKEQYPQWLRSSQVKKMLNISSGTLQTLRIKKIINANKVGSLYYYKLSEVNTLLETGAPLKDMK